MAVTCGNCGEELLGAVNRCWRCGQLALSTPEAASAPPVRRAPIGFDVGEVPRRKTEPVEPGVLTAAVVANDSASETPESEAAVTEAQSELAIGFGDAADSPSPVAANANSASAPSIFDELPRLPQTQAPTAAAERPHETWQSWLAIASVALGLLSISCGWLTAWMVIPAAMGLACGIFGAMGRRQGTAIFGLLLCLFGITVSSVRLAYDTFIFIRGEPPIQMNTDPEDSALDPLDAMEPYDSMGPLE